MDIEGDDISLPFISYPLRAEFALYVSDIDFTKTYNSSKILAVEPICNPIYETGDVD